MKETQEQVNKYHEKDIWFYLRENGQERYKFLASLIPKECKTVLDAGCGEALILPYLPENICYHGFDLSNFIIEKNFKTYEERFASGHAWFTVDNIFNPQLKDKFDCVLMLSVFAQLNAREILNLIRTTAQTFQPKIIIASSITSHLTEEVIKLIGKEFNILQNIKKTFPLIDKLIGVGTPEQINNRQILLLKVG